MKGNYTFDKKTFNEQLTKVSNGKKKTEIEQECDLPKGVLSKYTIDKEGYQIPPIDVLMRIANTYKCSLDDLVNGNSEIKNTNQYVDFSDFARDLLCIYENENCHIESINKGKNYCIVFEGEKVSELLSDLAGLEKLKDNRSYESIYAKWKKTILEDGKKYLKREDPNVNETDYYTEDIDELNNRLGKLMKKWQNKPE